MPKPKAFIVDWLAEARALVPVIRQLRCPPGLLVTDPEAYRDSTRPELVRIRHLRDKVSVFLADRINRKPLLVKPEKGYSYGIFTEDPERILSLMFELQAKLGFEFTVSESRAVLVLGMLSEILRDGWIKPYSREALAVQVASIQGDSQASVSSRNAKGTRPKVDRRSTLSKAIAKERDDDPHATCSEVLHRLVGGEVVLKHEADRVYYWDQKDRVQSVGLDRFETIFSEQKPSTG